MTWELESANALPRHEASISEASLPKVMCESTRIEVTFHASIIVEIMHHVILKLSPGLGRIRVVGLASHRALNQLLFQ